MVLGPILSQHHRLLIIQGPIRKRETTLGIQKKETVVQERGRGRETNRRTVRQCTKAPLPLGRQDTGRRWYNWIPGVKVTPQETESRQTYPIGAGDPRNREAALEMSPKVVRESEEDPAILLLCLPLAKASWTTPDSETLERQRAEGLTARGRGTAGKGSEHT